MADLPEAASITVGFSVQNDGELIGIHWDMPLCAFVAGVPIATAEALAEQFPIQLRQVIDEAKKAKSGLVVANGETMNVLKGK